MLRFVPVSVLASSIVLVSPVSINAHELSIRSQIQVRTASGEQVSYSAETLPSGANITAVTITAIYSTQEPMAYGTIQIYAPGSPDRPWRTDRLNENGEYRFSPDLNQRGRWTIRVEADGHSNFINLVI